MGQGESQTRSETLLNGGAYEDCSLEELKCLALDRCLSLTQRQGLMETDRATLLTLLQAYDRGMQDAAASGKPLLRRSQSEPECLSDCYSNHAVLAEAVTEQAVLDAPGPKGLDIGGTLVKVALALPQRSNHHCVFPESFGSSGRTRPDLEFEFRLGRGSGYQLKFVSGATAHVEQAIRNIRNHREEAKKKSMSGYAADDSATPLRPGNAYHPANTQDSAEPVSNAVLNTLTKTLPVDQQIGESSTSQAMAAPIVESVEQIQGGPVQQVFAPFTPYVDYDPSTQAAFAAAPESCEGAWFHPYGGYCVPQRAPVWNGEFPAQTTRDLPPLPQRPVHVRLSNLPRILCTDGCLQAAIEQARLDKDVRSVEIDDATACEAIVILTSEAAAQRCIRHFNGLRWAKSSTPVSARYTSPGNKEAAQQDKDDQSPHGAKEGDSEDSSEAFKTVTDDIEKAATEAQKKVGEARTMMNAKMQVAQKYAPEAKKKGVGEYSAMSSKLSDLQAQVLPCKTFKKDFKQRVEARKSIQEFVGKIGEAELEVEKASLVSASAAKAETEAGSVATASTSGIPFLEDTIHIRRLAMKQLPSKPRWADFEDDEDFEEDCRSTLAGTSADASSVAESRLCSPAGTCGDATSGAESV